MKLEELDISPDFIALGLLWKAQKDGNNLCLTELANKMKSVCDKMRVMSAQDRLYDLGLINTKWSKKDGKHMQIIIVDGVATKIANEILNYMIEQEESE